MDGIATGRLDGIATGEPLVAARVQPARGLRGTRDKAARPAAVIQDRLLGRLNADLRWSTRSDERSTGPGVSAHAFARRGGTGTQVVVA
ncbi:hypothetical protein C3Y87_01395 [Carbonactinospora thermoautotrophica]|uniref:hypothetical protein n=1 Tax=Carbonactinospora thermoautotrophica TaxID=1469144 RepID=UPI00226F3C95|nr:hypothetical protein [Carbonactinospora thermoautotrophica]MCX9190087.1 hypothetical protein [Carbonactinospora thermoautotrophica]